SCGRWLGPCPCPRPSLHPDSGWKAGAALQSKKGCPPTSQALYVGPASARPRLGPENSAVAAALAVPTPLPDCPTGRSWALQTREKTESPWLAEFLRVFPSYTLWYTVYNIHKATPSQRHPRARRSSWTMRTSFKGQSWPNS